MLPIGQYERAGADRVSGQVILAVGQLVAVGILVAAVVIIGFLRGDGAGTCQRVGEQRIPTAEVADDLIIAGNLSIVKL